MGDALHQEVTPDRTCRSWLAPAILAFASHVLAAGPSLAQETEDKGAKKLYKKGVALAKDGDYQEAIDTFEEARTRGAPDETLFNIGKCYEALGLFYIAVQYYEKYLASPDAKMKEDIEATINELALKPSPLHFTSEPPGAEVRQVLEDGTESKMGTTPFEYVAPAGEFAFAVYKEGFEKKISSIKTGYGKPYDLRINLGATSTEVEVVETAAPEKAEKPKGEPKPSRFPALGPAIEVGVGAALHPYGGVDFDASAVFTLGFAWRFTLGLLNGFAIGARFDLKSLHLSGVEFTSGDEGEWDATLADVLVVPSYQFRVHESLAIEASLPIGVAMIVPPGGMPDEARIDLVGGYVDGTLAMFDAGAGLALRIRIVSGLYAVVEPIRLHVLVPFKKWPSGTGAVVDLDLAVRAGFQF